MWILHRRSDWPSSVSQSSLRVLLCMMPAAFWRLSSTCELVKLPASFMMLGINFSHLVVSTFFTGFGSPPIFSGVEGDLPGPVTTEPEDAVL